MSRKIRTLLFSTLYPSSERPLHGVFVETRLRELLKSGKAEARVVAPVPWFFSGHKAFGEYAVFARTPRKETRNGIEVWHPRYALPPKVGLQMAPFLMAMGALPVVRQIQREGFDFDLIDAHFYYPDGMAAALVARALGKPFTVTARGSDIHTFPDHFLVSSMVLWTARQAMASIAVCKALRDEMAAIGMDEGKLHVLRNGVDLERFQPMDRRVARQTLGWPDVPTLFSVGRLVELKGHHVVIRALPSLRGFRLVIAGTGPDRERLEQLARELNVADRVQFAGSVPNTELARYYSAADIMVLASSREGWANVLLEAMACGTPVVATKVWGTPEVVADAVAGRLVPERTPSAFAEAIGALFANPPSREYVRNYAGKFSWEATTEAQVGLFGNYRP